jgi:hypothetical protein
VVSYNHKFGQCFPCFIPVFDDLFADWFSDLFPKVFLAKLSVVVFIHTCKRELIPAHLVCPWRHNA